MDYHCKTSFLSDLMVVDEFTIKVVLPEGSKHPSTVVPFPLQQHMEGNFMSTD
ncbi:hypothetical protein CsSME_00028424 [Camellia sinensis var. sinensis]